MEVFGVAVLLGLIPAAIAHSKGDSFFGFWIYGALLFIVALPHAILMKPKTAVLEAREIESGGSKRCPRCAELVQAGAKVCRYCGNEDFPATSPGSRPRRPEGSQERTTVAVILGLLIAAMLIVGFAFLRRL